MPFILPPVPMNDAAEATRSKLDVLHLRHFAQTACFMSLVKFLIDELSSTSPALSQS
jgi:hypothetical protein